MSCACLIHDNHQEKSTIIRNPKSNFVLDASEYHVKLQPFTGSSAQLWTLKCIAHGRFIIKNKGNGKVLDIEGGAKSQNKLITFERHDGENQQWHVNSDGTVSSPAIGNLVLDIYGGLYHAGNNIIAFPKHGLENQIFRLDYQ